jgi:dihydroneopterin aldolase/2-amino-4-hydroxy-6-hydroxymethyldihydropteridine diphosphokinase
MTRLDLDKITLTGLRVRGRHGVFAHEREDGQEFVVDAVLWLDTRPAAATDELSRTADYGAVADQLAAIVAGEPVALIETLAQRLAAECLTVPAVRAAEITVHKPAAPVAQRVADISVTIRRSRAEVQVVLALGSNIGDRLSNLQRAVDLLCRADVVCTTVSPVYETVPVGGVNQDDYLNAVMLATTDLTAAELLARCQAAEDELGRVREVRWGARTLDVDIIAYGTQVSDDPALTLPHPRAHERAFVLAPWLDADPAAALPGNGAVADLLAAVGTVGVTRLPGQELTLPAGGYGGSSPQASTGAATS